MCIRDRYKCSEKSDGFTKTYVTVGSEENKESRTITKEVTGKMGDLNREFEFTITVSDNDENAVEKYYMVVTNKKGETHTTPFTLTAVSYTHLASRETVFTWELLQPGRKPYR